MLVGNDPIVAEVLMLVPILVVEQVTQLSRWRYLGKIVEEIEEWRTLLLILFGASLEKRACDLSTTEVLHW